MTNWLSVPVFGSPDSPFPTVIRPSAYAIVSDAHGRLAVVRTPVGVYLPGGGQDDNETPEAAVAREVREECGVIVRVGTWRRAAIEHVVSEIARTQFQKQCTFCDAAVTGSSVEPTDLDHELIWVSSANAIEMLRPASHRWAVAEWIERDRHQI